MKIPGHDLIITRHATNRMLMRADCACGRTGCVYFTTIEMVEKSYAQHVAHIASLAVIALEEIDLAMSSTRADGGPAAVQGALARFRSMERW